MKRILLAINHSYLMFGTTVYVGVLWALHFFWYPSWRAITLDGVQDHFIGPTSAATKFFTIVVPLMFLAGAVLVFMEWRTKLRWWAVAALLCIAGATYVGQVHIIPINKRIGAGVNDPSELTGLLQQWMFLNDVRWVIMTAMWGVMMYYFIAKGNLLDKIARREA
jgi:hypothetical protein